MLTTNDANNYLARTIADQVTLQVRDSLARQVGEQAATTFLSGLRDDPRSSSTRPSTAPRSWSTGAQQAEYGRDQLARAPRSSPPAAAAARPGREQLAPGAAQAAAGARSCPPGPARLADGLGTLRTATARCPRRPGGWPSGAQQVAAGNARIAGVGDRVAGRERHGWPATSPPTARSSTRELRAAGLTDGAARAGRWP